METFGRYTLIRRVGMGGMAEIWKAKVIGPAGFEKTVAVKKILPEFTGDGDFLNMFIHEAKLVADLAHPNIVQVLDFGQVGPTGYFIAMEYVAGVNFGGLLRGLRERGTTPPREVVLFVVLEAARGLGYAHAKTSSSGRPLQIVHRDVSPSNILLSYGGEVKVADFGIAKAESARSQTASGFVRGKVAYMSPEQARGEEIDHRSDLFALGLLFYEALTGTRLFNGPNSRETYDRVTTFPGATPELLAPIPAEMHPILRRALQPDRNRRYQLGVEIEADIALLLGAEGQMAARHGISSILQSVFGGDQAEHTPSGGAIEHPPMSLFRSDQTEPGSPGRQSFARLEASSVPPGLLPAVGASRGSVESPFGDTVISPSPAVENISRELPRAVEPGESSAPTLAKQSVQSGETVIGGDTVIGAPPRSGLSAKPRKTRWKQASVIAVACLSVVGVGLIVAGPWTPVESPEPARSPVVGESALPTTAPVTSPLVATMTSATALPQASASLAVVIATPRPRPTVVARVAMGTLSVSARPWVEVWVDGKRIARDTPLAGYRLPAGNHEGMFVNPATGFRASYRLSIVADHDLALFVDVKQGTVTTRGK